MIIRIERLPTEAEHDETIKSLRLTTFETKEDFESYIKKHGITLVDESEEEKLFRETFPPKVTVRQSLETRDLDVNETTFNELTAVFNEFNIPYEPIDNGIKITYLSNEGLAYLGFYMDENGEVKEFDD